MHFAKHAILLFKNYEFSPAGFSGYLNITQLKKLGGAAFKANEIVDDKRTSIPFAGDRFPFLHNLCFTIVTRAKNKALREKLVVFPIFQCDYFLLVL